MKTTDTKRLNNIEDVVRYIIENNLDPKSLIKRGILFESDLLGYGKAKPIESYMKKVKIDGKVYIIYRKGSYIYFPNTMEIFISNLNDEDVVKAILNRDYFKVYSFNIFDCIKLSTPEDKYEEDDCDYDTDEYDIDMNLFNEEFKKYKKDFQSYFPKDYFDKIYKAVTESFIYDYHSIKNVERELVNLFRNAVYDRYLHGGDINEYVDLGGNTLIWFPKNKNAKIIAGYKVDRGRLSSFWTLDKCWNGRHENYYYYNLTYTEESESSLYSKYSANLLIELRIRSHKYFSGIYKVEIIWRQFSYNNYSEFIIKESDLDTFIAELKDNGFFYSPESNSYYTIISPKSLNVIDWISKKYKTSVLLYLKQHDKRYIYEYTPQGQAINFEQDRTLLPDYACNYYFSALNPYSIYVNLKSVLEKWEGSYVEEFIKAKTPKGKVKLAPGGCFSNKNSYLILTKSDGENVVEAEYVIS